MTITNLSAAIESLREIVGLMTPGEWLQPDGAEGDLWNNDAEPGERQTPDRVVVQSPSKPSWVKDRTWDEWRCENEHNLAGIVALRNTALPVIDAQSVRIAELEAALQRIALETTDVVRELDNYGGCIWAVNSHARAALNGGNHE